MLVYRGDRDFATSSPVYDASSIKTSSKADLFGPPRIQQYANVVNHFNKMQDVLAELIAQRNIRPSAN